MQKPLVKHITFAFTLLVLISCSGPPAITPTTTVTPSVTATHTQVPNATETPLQPTATNSLPTDTINPTATLETTTDPPTFYPSELGLEKELRVVYTHENNLWLWKSDGTTTQLTDSYEAFSPKISTDGNSVAYLKGWDIYNAEMWIVNLDGSDNRALVDQDHLSQLPRNENALGTMIGSFAWVPGKQQLAYNTIQLFEGPGIPRNDDLRVIDTETGTHSTLFEPGQGGEFTFSPDGNQIAIVTSNSLSLVNSDTSNRRDILNFPLVYTYSEWHYYPQPVWASNSGYLRVAIPPQDPLENPQAFTFVWHIPADGSLPYMAGEFISAPAYLSSPLISPDTEKIIYLDVAGETFEQLELIFLDLTTGDQNILYAGNIRLHNWNPNSNQFVFSQNFNTDFYLGQPDTPPQKIADFPIRQSFEWLDTEHYIFTSGDVEFRELRIGKHNTPSIIIAQPFGELFSFDFFPKP